VIEPVALGRGAGELIGGDRAVLEQQAFGRQSAGAAFLDRRLDSVRFAEAHFDEHVGEEAVRAAAPSGSADAVVPGSARFDLVVRVDGVQARG
jgi:hypothetical protein